LQQQLKKLEDSGDTTSETVQAMRAELNRMDNVYFELVALSKVGMEREEMRKKYSSEPHIWLFYNTLVIRFEELLLGVKSAASGMVDHNKDGTAGKVGGVLCLLGELVELVPIVGEFGKLVTKAGEVIHGIDHKRQQNIIKRISSFGTLAELQNLSASVAVALTMRYEFQLLQL
jgi:hypothetical protein